jgi:hypothetical protein
LLNHNGSGDVTAGYVQYSVENLREPMKMVEDFVINSSSIRPITFIYLYRNIE